VIIVLFGALAGMLRTASYTWYCAAVAALVLIAMDMAHPTNLNAEGRRILFTLIGVGIGVLMMLPRRPAGQAPIRPSAVKTRGKDLTVGARAT
jgi:hypothetical protein